MHLTLLSQSHRTKFATWNISVFGGENSNAKIVVQTAASATTVQTTTLSQVLKKHLQMVSYHTDQHNKKSKDSVEE